MALRDLSTEFGNVADLLDLASNMLVENMARISIVEDAGYTLPHAEANQLSSLLVVAREYSARVRREMDEACLKAIEKAQRGFQGEAAHKSSATPDPFVERMAVYDRDIAAFNSNDDNGPEPGGAFCDEIRSGKLAIGNVEGAILALRRIKAIACIIDTEGDCMVDAVIAFLEQGRA